MYDKEKVYDEKINPLMEQIIDICKENDLQMLASFALKERDKSGEDLKCTTYIPSEEYASSCIQDAYKVVKFGYVAQKPFCGAVSITKSN